MVYYLNSQLHIVTDPDEHDLGHVVALLTWNRIPGAIDRGFYATYTHMGVRGQHTLHVPHVYSKQGLRLGLSGALLFEPCGIAHCHHVRNNCPHRQVGCRRNAVITSKLEPSGFKCPRIILKRSGSPADMAPHTKTRPPLKFIAVTTQLSNNSSPFFLYIMDVFHPITV